MKQFARFLYCRVYAIVRSRFPSAPDRELLSLMVVVVLFSFNGYCLLLLLPQALGLNFPWLWLSIPGSILGALIVSILSLLEGGFWLNPSLKSLQWRIYRSRAGKLLAMMYIFATLVLLLCLLTVI